MYTNTENMCADTNSTNEANVVSDQDLKSQIPQLPEGKTKHFFVSYSSFDKQCVFSIVDELEKRFGLECIFDDRDFQAGKDIPVNIREGMMHSLKVLLFLTPSFLQSAWCKYETDVAFVKSMGCGYSCIVPVLLQECEIPPTLVTLTYIDATIPGIDLCKKIASALLRPATDDGLFPLNIRTWSKIHENGYCYIIPAKRDKLWSCRPAKYRFAVDNDMLEKLRENRVEVPEELLRETVDILNKDSIMWSYDYLSPCRNFIWTFLLIPLYMLIYGLAKNSWILHLATRTGVWVYGVRKDFYPWSLMLIFMLLSFVVIQLPLCLIPDICYRKKESFVGIIKAKNLTPFDRTLTPEVKYNHLEDMEGIFTCTCTLPYGNGVTTYADMLIERHLSEISSTLANNFDNLPDAPYNRHHVKNGKMCICQQLENNLSRLIVRTRRHSASVEEPA